MERKQRWRRDKPSGPAPPESAGYPLAAGVLRKVEPEAEDPRGAPGARAPRQGGRGRNTESFDPKTTLRRPDMRILVGSRKKRYGKPLRNDDVLQVPELFCDEDDYTLYHRLIEEVQELQQGQVREAEWIPWHEGCHLITKNPEGAPLFRSIVEKMSEYLDLDPQDQATRFNWYKDSSDWKPFHHDSAAFNEHRARTQNITVGASFGAERELAFLHAKSGSLTYFPQPNGGLFSFGKDVNIRWKHGINALPPEVAQGSGAINAVAGRVSIILWGRCRNMVEEEGSPALLTEEVRGNAGYASDLVCRDFLRGFCHSGAQCGMRHV